MENPHWFYPSGILMRTARVARLRLKRVQSGVFFVFFLSLIIDVHKVMHFISSLCSFRVSLPGLGSGSALTRRPSGHYLQTLIFF